jgi:VanZ family protein
MNIFSSNPVYKKGARSIAILWTLLILFLCFIPAREVPNVRVPFADKWVHFILFGIFAFLWLLSLQRVQSRQLIIVLIITIVFGWLVEYIQGLLAFLGRYQDNWDTLADAVGGALGVLLFQILPNRKKVS